MADTDNKQLSKSEPEASPKTKPEPKSSKDTPAATPRKKRFTLAVFNLILLLIISAATAAAAYYLWQQQISLLDNQNRDSASLRQQLNQLSSQSTSTTNAIKQSVSENNAQLQQLSQQQRDLTELSQQAIAITNRQQRGWILAEIDYLMRMANRRLQIGRDINSAIAALTAANQRIFDLGDLSLFKIRQQLSQDIATLKTIQQVDVNGTALALDQMIEHLTELPFKSVVDEVKTQFETPQPATSKPKPAEGFVDSVIDTLKNIGDIKIHDRAIDPASSAEQQQHIEQILRTHLLGARLAILRLDQSQFSHDLQQALQILHAHYKTTDNRVSQMNTDLTNMSTLALTPQLPDITASWSMLQKALQTEDAKPKQEPATQNKSSQEVM